MEKIALKKNSNFLLAQRPYNESSNIVNILSISSNPYR